jgi:hypothetical protein
MTKRIITGWLAVFLWAASFAQVPEKTMAAVVPDTTDSLTYELIITDNDFEQWYLLHFDPSKDYPDDYYHARNLVAVQNWNEFYDSGKYRNFLLSHINYLPGISYGIDLNRRLYWYFRFVDSEYNIPLFLP